MSKVLKAVEIVEVIPQTSNTCVVMYPIYGVPRCYGPFQCREDGMAEAALIWIKENKIDHDKCLILFLEEPAAIKVYR